MHPDKPYSASCDENREPIFAVLQPRLQQAESLLEIGSGTGQHAVYFAPALPHLTWQTSDQREYHPGILAWLDAARSENIRAPLALEVTSDPWPTERYDAVFSANTAHIMNEAAAAAMLAGVGRALSAGGLFLLYGPFNRDGRYTSTSNADFDQWLKRRDPDSGIKDIAWLAAHAEQAGLQLAEEIAMPANNLILVWRRTPHVRP